MQKLTARFSRTLRFISRKMCDVSLILALEKRVIGRIEKWSSFAAKVQKRAKTFGPCAAANTPDDISENGVSSRD